MTYIPGNTPNVPQTLIEYSRTLKKEKSVGIGRKQETALRVIPFPAAHDGGTDMKHARTALFAVHSTGNRKSVQGFHK
ncbi:MAG: hypothetical protein LBD08_03515 [Treponema sp.]|jgi:hypothetical protein|nr:hypothetical protein [Treponema sp.]